MYSQTIPTAIGSIQVAAGLVIDVTTRVARRACGRSRHCSLLVGDGDVFSGRTVVASGHNPPVGGFVPGEPLG
jgi:hypothetical protein